MTIRRAPQPGSVHRVEPAVAGSRATEESPITGSHAGPAERSSRHAGHRALVPGDPIHTAASAASTTVAGVASGKTACAAKAPRLSPLTASRGRASAGSAATAASTACHSACASSCDARWSTRNDSHDGRTEYCEDTVAMSPPVSSSGASTSAGSR